jgi:hypothetical protein
MNIQYLQAGLAYLDEETVVEIESAIVGEQVATLFAIAEEINDQGEEWYLLGLRVGRSIEENVEWYFYGDGVVESTGRVGVSGLIAAKNLLMRFEEKKAGCSYGRFIYFNAADERRMKVYGFLTRLGYEYSENGEYLVKKI